MKIGYTAKKVEYRLAQLKQRSEHKLTLLGVLHGAREKERILHDRFSEFHITGEWFEEVPEIYDYLDSQEKAPDKEEDSIPLTLRRVVQRVGKQIRNARLRRRIKASELSQRANMSRTTLSKIEHGSADVSMLGYVKVLKSLGLETDLLLIAKDDERGREISEASLPKRIRT